MVRDPLSRETQTAPPSGTPSTSTLISRASAYYREPQEKPMPGFTLRKATRKSYEQVLALLPELLKAEGFGVLTQIDVKDTMKQKIGAEFRKYRILGACNPHLAHEVLSVDLEVGVMLPCNVVVYEGDDGNAVVLAIDPMQAIAAANPAIRPVAERVRDGLARVLARVE
jgi:uncharacterized protein (DUF302 family)